MARSLRTAEEAEVDIGTFGKLATVEIPSQFVFGKTRVVMGTSEALGMWPWLRASGAATRMIAAY
jgi:hypothetical protein